MKEFIELLEYVRKNGGSYCIWCGITFTSIREARKHDLGEHYDYCLTQCHGDKELLKEWANLP